MRLKKMPEGTLPPRPATRGRYLIRARKSAALVCAIDAGLRLVPVRRLQPQVYYERILLSNWGHLGDVVLTLPAVAVLRKHYPGALIGMIVGSWAKPVVEGSGLVDHLHVIDHWIVSRANGGKYTRWKKTRHQSLNEIRSHRYEIGIDFYPFFPPAHPLFWIAGIKRRVGFDSTGFGPLLTSPVRWRDADRPVSDYARDLLDQVLPLPTSPQELKFSYPTSNFPPLPAGLATGSYTVVHPGAGAPFKDWGEWNWRTLVMALRKQGRHLVLTGTGESEISLAQRLQGDGISNLVGKLDWNGLVAVIANASALICPDTVVGHLGALFQVPTVAIYTGTNNSAQWGPLNPRARILVKYTACAPCNRPGCPAMTCIRTTAPSDVLDALKVLQA